ncbi:choice-of-anchor J domain-containing protein [Virgibacillus doumboii]|uniref:choice-of-anchor J domain-containing protein n=1 Tax=Virgibacillus doumboii TaxID=2697503 RepID=UPI0013DFE2E3|nr:choice-of-anchor J domain-containing protein [Virgibacillus doumboii]
MKKLWKLVAAILLAIPIGFYAIGSGTAEAADNSKPEPIDIGPELRKETVKEADFDKSSIPFRSFSNGQSQGYEPVPGTERLWVALDQTKGQYYLKPFTLKAVGEHAEIWVANDRKFPQENRNDTIQITQEQVDYILSEVDSNIYPTDTEFFGTPNSHSGENALLEGQLGDNYYVSQDQSDRSVILIDNVKDENFYNPDFPSYVAGFFSQVLEQYTDRNIITIDSYDWANRVGDDAANPNLYEGTVAHEYQHLIHADNDPGEETWINEGMSDFAEYLVGYGHPQGHIESFAEKPENSLVAWEDQGPREVLADYGNAYLFQLYLNDHFGGQEFIQNLAKNKLPGIKGVNDALNAFGYDKTFDDVYRDYQTALVIDEEREFDGKYGFTSIDFTVNTGTEQAYASEGAPSWGSDFIEMPVQEDKELYFNGLDFMPLQWESTADPKDNSNKVLWGGTGSLVDHFLVREFDLTGTQNPELTFDTFYNIESTWDYGFVQISTDGGKTWTSLANENTKDEVNESAHPKVKSNVPGFTGASNGWTTQSFDLSEYAGEKILVGFRYVTDWASQEAGWYIDNIQVDAVSYSNDGSSTGDFKTLDEVVKNYVNYLVSFIKIEEDDDETEYEVKEVDPLNFTNDEMVELEKYMESEDDERVIMTVTHGAPDNGLNNAAYSYELREEDDEDEDDDDWDDGHWDDDDRDDGDRDDGDWDDGHWDDDDHDDGNRDDDDRDDDDRGDGYWDNDDWDHGYWWRR